MKKHPLGQNPDFRKLFQQLNGQYSGKKPEDGQGEKDGTPEPERFDSNGNPVKKKKKRRRFARGGKVAAAAVILILLGTNSYYMKKIMQLSVRWEVPRQYLRQGFILKSHLSRMFAGYPRALRECRLAMTLRPERVMNLNLS